MSALAQITNDSPVSHLVQEPWLQDFEEQTPREIQNPKNNKSDASPQSKLDSYAGQGYYYSSAEFAYSFKNQDGDQVQISGKLEVATAYDFKLKGNFNKDQISKFMDDLQKSILEGHRKLIGAIMGKSGDALAAWNPINPQDLTELQSAGTDESSKDADVPEYWNAENTSDRLVAFATSFFGMAGMDGNAYHDRMVRAIEEGFSQAWDMLGNLPGPVGNLINHTHDLTMDKLGKWKEEQLSKTQNLQA